MDQKESKADADSFEIDLKEDDIEQPSISASGEPISSLDAGNTQMNPAKRSFPDQDDDEDDDEEIVTLEDYLREEDDMDTQVMAVIGNADRNNCSYPKV